MGSIFLMDDTGKEVRSIFLLISTEKRAHYVMVPWAMWTVRMVDLSVEGLFLSVFTIPVLKDVFWRLFLFCRKCKLGHEEAQRLRSSVWKDGKADKKLKVKTSSFSSTFEHLLVDSFVCKSESGSITLNHNKQLSGPSFRPAQICGQLLTNSLSSFINPFQPF